MNRIKKLAAVFAFSLLILGLPAIATAQNRDRDCEDNNGRNNRNGGYNRNTGYGNDDDYYGRNGGYSRGQLQSSVERLKNNSKEFARRLDRELNNSRYNNDDRLLDLAKDFRKAADKLEDEFDGGRNLNDSANEARRVLDLGRQLNNELYDARLSYNIENDWRSISQDLRIISDAYGYGSYNNGNNRNRNRRNDPWGRGNGRGNGNGNGGWRNKVPFPLPF